MKYGTKNGGGECTTHTKSEKWYEIEQERTRFTRIILVLYPFVPFNCNRETHKAFDR